MGLRFLAHYRRAAALKLAAISSPWCRVLFKKEVVGASQNFTVGCASSSAEWKAVRQCWGPQALLVQMQSKLPLVSAAGIRLGTAGLSPGSRSSLLTVSQHCVVKALLAAASHNFCFPRGVAACLWCVAWWAVLMEWLLFLSFFQTKSTWRRRRSWRWSWQLCVLPMRTSGGTLKSSTRP